MVALDGAIATRRRVPCVSSCRTQRESQGKWRNVPTLEAFAPRFIEGYARANRQKPSGIAAKEAILRIASDPGTRLTDARHDQQRAGAATQAAPAREVTEDGQQRVERAQRAVEAGGRVGRARQAALFDQTVRVARTDAAFHDFEAYERLLEAAQAIDPRSYVIALLGGEAGLRAGEIVALEWADVDLERRQIRVRHSDWCGELTTPKNGRIRFVGMTERLATALRQHRHLRSRRVLCKNDGTPLTRQGAWSRVRYAAKRAKVPTGVHILRHTFCSHLAMQGAPMRGVQELVGHQSLAMTQRYSHLSPAAPRRDDPVARKRGRRCEQLETLWRACRARSVHAAGASPAPGRVGTPG